MSPQVPRPGGFTGKILWVDLAAQTVTEEPVPAEVYRKYVGGYGLGAYFIYTRTPPDADPLGPGNVLGFCPGLLTGTPAPFTGRYMVCGKSPLTGKGPRGGTETIITKDAPRATGGWGDANAGGYFGPAIKRAGYDGLFFTGVAPDPVYLLVDADGPRLESCPDLWGKDALETDDILTGRHGTRVKVAAIGRAGENRSLLAGIVNDRGRIAARSGLGAVMGAKHLKALALIGTDAIPMHDRRRVVELAKAYRSVQERHYSSPTTGMLARFVPKISFLLRWMRQGTTGDAYMFGKTLHDYGTSFSTGISAEIGDAPIKNHQGVGYRDWPQATARSFSGNNLLRYKKKSYGCFACPLRCGAILEVPEAGLAETHRPEYETLAAFGGLILNDDVTVVFEANEYLNRHGMDTISAGGVLAFVNECVERGILTRRDFACARYPEGFLPGWHRSEYILPLLELMVTREGIGDVLADGVRAASHHLGHGSAEFACHANGQELPMHDARLTPGLMMSYLADPTPGRHTSACLDFSAQGPVNQFVKGLSFANGTAPRVKGARNVKFAKFKQVFNALGFCDIALWQGRYPFLEMIAAVTGWAVDVEEVLRTGWRIQALRQMFNAREGAIRHEVPARRTIGDPPLDEGPLAHKRVPVEEMIQGYYAEIGFTGTGVPRPETLERLDLDFAVPDLARATGRPESVVPP